MKTPALVLALTLLVLAWGCGDQFSHASRPTDRFRNDTLQFPGLPYTDIRAVEQAVPQGASGLLLPTGVSGRSLSPAHRADLQVALAMPPDTVMPASCEQARQAIVFLNDAVPIAAINLNFECGYYRFEPASAHRLGPNNLARLQLIFAESTPEK